MKKGVLLSILFVFAFVVAGNVSAHVTVQPKETIPGYTVSSVRVPNERDVATTAIRVVVPDGVDVHGVMPIAGWKHEEKHESETNTLTDEDGHEEESVGRITEITWTGGKIGVGEFMEFPLSVQYTSEKDTAMWKAYQTYADGQVVSWDGSDDKHPAPVVSVIKQATIVGSQTSAAGRSADQSTWMSVAALLFSVTALAVGLKKK